ncbi:hypothetical protein NFC81_02535 [Salinispirillum sp. LH 10-3-1]|uniref:Uncharacterized protein n=1 Tax=Salinispirillum sp. LH 10-3-1 TaxID=2952525 RepID=A0AB38YH28_9GAMM
MRHGIRFCLFFLFVASTHVQAELLRVRSDPVFAALVSSVNAELDFAWQEQRTWSLGLYYSDGWPFFNDSVRVFSPALRVDFYRDGPLTNGWHPNVMVQADIVTRDTGELTVSGRIKARQSYQWVWDPVSLSVGLGAQTGVGEFYREITCVICPTYEFSLGWQL